jgi:N utilization substance protein B
MTEPAPRPPHRTSTRRRRLREAVVRVLYARDVSGTDLDGALAGYRDSLADGPVHDDLEPWLRGIEEHRDEIDALIRAASLHWRIDRFGALERSILRLGAWELLHRPEIPARASINEAVEIARRFGGEESPSFVNGILDRVARTLDARRGEVR